MTNVALFVSDYLKPCLCNVGFKHQSILSVILAMFHVFKVNWLGTNRF